MTKKVSLTLLKFPVSAEQLAELFEKITGRKPTEAEIEAARRTLAKTLNVLALTILMMGTVAQAQPLPYPKQGQCAGGYYQSGGFCVPKSTTTKPSIPKVPGKQCPSGWSSGAASCTKM